MVKSEQEFDTEVDQFESLMGLAAEGDEAAWFELFVCFSDELRRATRAMLGHELRRYFETEDFIQDVFATLSRRRSGLVKFTNDRDFFCILRETARRKIVQKARFIRRKKRDCGISESLEANAGDVVAPEMGPEEQVILDDLWEGLLRDQTSDGQRMIRLRRDNFTMSEIAEQVGRHEDSVRRFFRRLFSR